MSDMLVVLRNGLNRCYEDGVRDICRATIVTYGDHQTDKIRFWLDRWIERGWLTQVKPFEEAEKLEVCVKMNSFLYPTDTPPYFWSDYSNDPDNPEYKIKLEQEH